MEGRLDVLVATEPILEGALAILMKVVNTTAMGKRRVANSHLLQIKSLMKETSQRWRSLPTVSIEMTAIQSMISKVMDMERRLGIMASLETGLDTMLTDLDTATAVTGMTERRMAKRKGAKM